MIHGTACMFWTKKVPCALLRTKENLHTALKGGRLAASTQALSAQDQKNPKASSHGAPDRKTTGRGIFKMWSWGLLWEFSVCHGNGLQEEERKRWLQRCRLGGKQTMALCVWERLNLVYTCPVAQPETEGFRKPRVGGSIWAPLGTKGPPTPPTLDSSAPNANHFHDLCEFCFCLLFCFMKS